MIAADRPRSSGVRLLMLRAGGALREAHAAELPSLLRRGDLVIANDAATIPASLHGVHERTGAEIEVRLAGFSSAPAHSLRHANKKFVAVVFGAGDWRTRTEDRALPPALREGDVAKLGPLRATVVRMLGHVRLVELAFEESDNAFWAGLARAGRAIQYAHVSEPVKLWDVWTRVAAMPFAFEAPSAGFVLSWAMLSEFADRGIGFATLTHAAGISSTGDEALDARLPFDEPYVIPAATVAAIRKTRAEGGRIVAIGTSVVRALESAAGEGALRAGPGVAKGRIELATRLKLVDAIVSGVHAPGESHHELLRAFAGDAALAKMAEVLEIGGFRNHEFGDFVLMERQARSIAAAQIAGATARVRYSRSQQEDLRS